LPDIVGAAHCAAGPVTFITMSARISVPVAVLLLRLRPKDKDAADAMELMDPRRPVLRLELSCIADAAFSLGCAAKGSGMLISMSRS